MKYRTYLSLAFIALLFLWAHVAAPGASAVNCSSIPVTGNYTVTETCSFPNTPYDGLDTGTVSTNTSVLTIGAAGSLSILNGQTLLLGSVTSSAGGAITIVDGGSFRTGSPVYVTDADGDLYAASGSRSSTGTTRQDTMTSTTADCYDSNANAKPGQTTYYTTNRGDGSFDYDCDSTQTRQYPTATYTCTSCTNGSGYASTINTTNGYQTSVPACGVAGTWYTVTNTTCRNPAVSACSGSYSTSSVTQPCR